MQIYEIASDHGTVGRCVINDQPAEAQKGAEKMKMECKPSRMDAGR